MKLLTDLQTWYQLQCNGEWEHRHGITIESLDNPGWRVTIDLAGTELENRHFERIMRGVGQDRHPVSDEWLSCEVIAKQFIGAGSPEKLEDILKIFLDWANSKDS